MGRVLARHPSSRELYLRLLGYVRPHARVFAVAILGMVLTAATEPLFPALMKPLLDGSFVNRDNTQTYVIPLALVGIFLLRGVLSYVTSYALAWVSNKVVLDIRNAMFSRLLALPTRYYDNESSGVLISKIAYDVNGVSSAATNVLTVLVRDSLAVVGLLGWLLYLNWKLTLVAIVVAPGIALAVKLFSKRLRRMSQNSMRAMADITHVLEESIECQKVVKIFGGQEYEARRFDRANQQLRGFNMRQTIAAAATVPIVQLFAAIAVAIIISMAVQQAAVQELTVGGFVSFITAMLMLLTPLKHLTEINAPLQRGLASAERVFELLDETVEEDSGKISLNRARGRIEFESVSLSYAGSSREALDGVSIRIEPGETVALVGPSGGGKTSFVNLLARFYPPSSGRILLDGIDLREVSLGSLRENISLVSQDVALFNDSIAANIAYGRMGGVSREAIEAAARAAHVHEFVRELSEGFDTLIGENGARLSGGQRQRVAIARAILKNAPILLLDEATSALDSESERHVQAALSTLMQDRTTIVIAHRLSTIERADRIVVLQRGRILESGSHAELLAKNGLYAQLYRIQFVLEDVGVQA
ncbi:MAG: lipid A export permease/ATP-binding protein MsbA [Betaproteobacteria bacterium]|nr:lipid A export permease/ATP-binding protein MsbA [Betaproteobacteria bacterium]